MKKSTLSLISFLLALTMLCGALAACGGDGNVTDTSVPTSAETESKTEKETEPNSESDSESVSASETDSEKTTETNKETDSEIGDGTESETEQVVELEGEHADLIMLSDKLANGVQAYFTDAYRTHYALKNLEMTMTYARSSAVDQQVASITNTKGKAYVENTMDVFVRMKNGDTFFASQSAKSAEANLYRFGYYYFEGLFEFQNFVPKNYEVTGAEEISIKRYNGSRSHNTIRKIVDGEGQITISDTNDPYMVFDNFNFDTANHDTMVITLKTVGNCSGGQLFISVNNKSFNEGQSTSVSFINDGEYHTYCIPLNTITNYDGVLTGFRLDPSGAVGDGIQIKEFKVGKANLGDVPQHLSINRHFHVYSDKMHQAIQFAVTETTPDIDAIGMVTELDASTVGSIIIQDKAGKNYTSLDGVNWADVIAVGFDVKDAGIFGFILPIDEKVAGKIKVTLDGDKYVIIQELTPENGTIKPSIGGTNDKGNYVHAEGVKRNGNDVYIGQRIYTDEHHDFEEFLFEVYCERNPLTEKNVKINAESSDKSFFEGYDSLRGIYVLNLVGVSGGFYQSYNIPNKNYRCNFNIVGLKEDRDIYIMTSPNSGILECAALMDGDLMMLPVPIEVIKNFSEATGERNLYNIDDPSFGESIFVLSLTENERYEYNIINLYQNWGKYPLKQLSQIPFHCPYYHLSTGATETNCILPWFGTANVGKGGPGNTLPDFRSMSAPFWKGQPQHNSCGSHYWLAYTDADGNYSSTESTLNTITSYGPTYAEVVMDAISDDGKIKVSYTHMEMPQLDENRTFYTMEYEFLEDLTINDFRHNFQFYKVTDNDGKGTYKRLGYLNEKNEYTVIDSNQSKTDVPGYKLGDKCPYFSFFYMPDWNRESTSAEGYSNVAFLVYNSEFIIGGEKVTPNFYINNPKDFVQITLDLDTVEFKKGDKMTINAILLPWGSQLYEDGIIDEATGNYEYDMELPDGTLYQDKNVRDVRENTLLNPLKVSSTTDEIIDSPFLPRVRSKDGKTAEFTLSGGENNVSVRVYGFDLLTAPKIEELVDGKWVEYKVSSAETPDSSGYYHYYDGYGVQYDGDGKYSYSFVTTMTAGAPRTFRVSATEEFRQWPAEVLPQANEDLLSVYVDPDEIKQAADLAQHVYGPATLSEDESYVRMSVNPDAGASEAYTQYYSSNGTEETGKYFVIKYRVPKTFSESYSYIEVWAKTADTSLTGGQDNFAIYPVIDGEWHIEVYDLTKKVKNFSADEDGKYYATKMRVDLFNKKFTDANNYIDIGFFAIEKDLSTICELVKDDFDSIVLYEGGVAIDIDTATGEKFVPTIIHPDSGYKQTSLAYGAILDGFNATKTSISSYSANNPPKTFIGVTVAKDYTISFPGWCTLEGGVEKYVWSVDGGKTWNDFPNADKLTNADDAMIANAENANKTKFNNVEATKKNGAFKQDGKLVVDLSAYKDQKVDLIIAAVPAAEEGTLAPLFLLQNIDCSVESVFVEDCEYAESSILFGSHIDFINDEAKSIESGTSMGGFGTATVNAKEDHTLNLVGWAAVDGGTEKYLWTADGGKTWNEITEGFKNGNNAIFVYGQKKAGKDFTSSEEDSSINVSFQGSPGLTLDLSAYKDATEPIEVYLVAVPRLNTESVIVLYKFNVNMGN